MSASKRRKVDQEATQYATAAVSALTALSARRRLAEGNELGDTTSAPASPEPRALPSNSNAFSVLQGLSRQGDSPSVAARQPESPGKPQRNKARHLKSAVVVLSSIQEQLPQTFQWHYGASAEGKRVLRSRRQTRLELHMDPCAPALRQLGRLSPLFRNLWNEPASLSFDILYSSEDAPRKSVIQELKSPPEWNKELDNLLAPSTNSTALTALVCGPKSAGKSTFSKILANRLITRSGEKGLVDKGVALLDLDPGQSEYALPGTISLVHVKEPNLSASFTHPSFANAASQIVRCHTIASVSPASDPDLYRAATFDLYATYAASLKGVPLIINTPGWILGTGLELLEDIIRHTTPDEVIYMSELGPADTVDSLRAATVKNFRTLPSQPSEFTARTGAHLRAMQTMSYFHLRPTSDPGRLSWNPSPLSQHPPLELRYAGSKGGIKGILCYNYEPPADLLASSINGMVLAVVVTGDRKAYGELVSSASADITISESPEGIPFIQNQNDASLDPRYSKTIGLVLVRGIDPARKVLQLLTPMSLDQIHTAMDLNQDLVLVHGKFDAPSWAYTEDLYHQSGDDDATTHLQIEDQDTDEDVSDREPEDVTEATDVGQVPWVEILRGHEKRPVGSKVWRVRRDLGRQNGE
ncbi:Polynucleotide 5'-hydroxyl-kinase-like protein [Emericellopsis cladophorae]|uniref:Polynucleotide 5'-hydroxyl-kinase GRC3 n=1 Tax=Emericellopsis cladophorae TaxID=2686198 RepID=A0A9P9XUC1_9HYPO|nr:Polynucleotide 5'-hydroxyl-kinase-like protein [Emericellopsis cladophorae]KAI6777939.1 Polynucleotide 5'-hydroxyl-kinase-like protein [Emericellopsis cladophorae]